MDDLSLAHSRYNCTYHIVFIPKVLVNNCVGDFVWRFMQSLESLYL